MNAMTGYIPCKIHYIYQRLRGIAEKKTEYIHTHFKIIIIGVNYEDDPLIIGMFYNEIHPS